MSSDRGSITLWLLGLVVLLLGIGGVVVDLWRVMGERSELVALVDSAAVAGASALDEGGLRSGEGVVLVPDEARRRAAAVLAVERPDRVMVVVDGASVVVTGERVVDLTLLRALVPEERPVTVRATATAVPEVRP